LCCRRIHLAGDTGRAQGRPEEIPGAQRVELRGIRQEQDLHHGDRAAGLRLRDRKLANIVRPDLGVHSQGEMGNVRPATPGRRPVRRRQHTEVRIFFQRCSSYNTVSSANSSTIF